MECSFTGSRLRDFVRALRCLSIFGDELNITATAEEFKLSAVSASRSAFALASFDSSFFSTYRLYGQEELQEARRPVASSSRTPSSPPPPEPVQIAVTAKTLLNALGKRAAMTSVEDVALSVVFDEQLEDQLSTECRLILKLHCKYGVVKTHRLTFAAETALTPLFDRSACTSHWSVSSATLDEWINHFSSSKRTGTEEISLLCASTFCKLKSYEPASEDFLLDPRERDDLYQRAVSTAVHVDPEEFDEYQVDHEDVLTFGLKEFKAMIHFGKDAGCSLEADYLMGGQPLMTSIRGDSFYADFVLATTADDPAKVKDEPLPETKTGNARSRAKSRTNSAAPMSAPGAQGPRNQHSRSVKASPSPSPPPPTPPLPSMTEVDRQLEEQQKQNPWALPQQKPLFRPSPSPTPTPGLGPTTIPGVPAYPSEESRQGNTHDQDDALQAQLDDDDFVIPDSEMNEAFEQWSQRQTTQSQRVSAGADPGAGARTQQVPAPSQASDDATQDSDAEVEARKPKKAKWQIFD